MIKEKRKLLFYQQLSNHIWKYLAAWKQNGTDLDYGLRAVQRVPQHWEQKTVVYLLPSLWLEMKLFGGWSQQSSCRKKSVQALTEGHCWWLLLKVFAPLPLHPFTCILNSSPILAFSFAVSFLHIYLDSFLIRVRDSLPLNICMVHSKCFFLVGVP